MAWILVRNLDHRTVAALERRAEEHRRSLAQEVRLIPEEAAQWAEADPGIAAERIRRNLRAPGGPFSDSGELQAKDRER